MYHFTPSYSLALLMHAICLSCHVLTYETTTNVPALKGGWHGKYIILLTSVWLIVSIKFIFCWFVLATKWALKVWHQTQASVNGRGYSWHHKGNRSKGLGAIMHSMTEDLSCEESNYGSDRADRKKRKSFLWVFIDWTKLNQNKHSSQLH